MRNSITIWQGVVILLFSIYIIWAIPIAFSNNSDVGVIDPLTFYFRLIGNIVK